MLEILPRHIEALSDEDLRTLIGRLAEQEARAFGHSPSHVTYGGHQDAKDEGIDVRVSLPEGASIAGYVPRAQTCFQIKAQDMPRKALLEEMAPDAALRGSIRALGQAGGAYIVASSKGSVSDPALTVRRNAMGEAIAGERDCDGLLLDFYDRQRIASWVNQHPGLAPWVRQKAGEPLQGWRPFEDWSSSPESVDGEYALDEGVRLMGVRLKDSSGLNAEVGIKVLRDALRPAGGVVRLVGLSGVGKTRLAQALFDARVGDDALSPHLALYTDLGDSPDPTPADLLERLQHLKLPAILIVDNCGLDLHRKLAARIKATKAGVSLLTIEYDLSDDEPEHTDVFHLEPSSEELIDKILARRHADLSPPERRAIAAFSGGNARVALALAQTAKDGPSLANLKDSELLERLFRQKNADDPILLRAAKTFSLVYSFDIETDGAESEMARLAALSGQSVADLRAHAGELLRRKLLQSRSKWRALLPHALAHKLAREALQDMSAAAIENELIKNAPERLVRSFTRRLGFLHDSPEAQAIAKAWFDKDGWLSDLLAFDDVRMTAFNNVAPIDPAAVLAAIETTIANSEAEVLESPILPQLVRMLRTLAYYAELFPRAAALLALLARQTKRQNYTDEAVNVFPSLFLMYLSGTHAPLAMRLDVLRARFQSSNETDVTLAVQSLKALLKTDHWISHYGFEFGARKRDYGYTPQLFSEVRAWYEAVYTFMRELAEADAGSLALVKAVMAGRLRWLAEHAGTPDALIALAEALHAKGGWSEGWVGARSAAKGAEKAGHGAMAARYRALAEQLKPVSLGQLIATYVLPEQYTQFDLADIDFDDDKRHEKARAHIEEVCADIGRRLAQDQCELQQHLPTLLTSRSERVWQTAMAVGRAAGDARALWDVIVEATLAADTRARANAFISAFLKGLADAGGGQAETLLDLAIGDARLHRRYPHMQNAVGFDGRGLTRFMAALDLKSVPTESLYGLTGGSACDGLSGAHFRALLEKVATRDDGGVDVAMDVLHMRVWHFEARKLALSEDDRQTARLLLGALNFDKRKNREDHQAAEIVNATLSAPEDEGIARHLCEKLLGCLVEHHAYPRDYADLVEALSALFPETVFDVLVDSDLVTAEERHSIFRDLRSHRTCPFAKADVERVVDWASRAPERRFVRLGETLRLWRKPNEKAPLEWTPMVWRLIHAAPDPLAVLEAMFDQFDPMSWSGSRAAKMEGRLPLFTTLMASENSEIAAWAKAADARFKADIAETRKWESGRARVRDERFEW